MEKNLWFITHSPIISFPVQNPRHSLLETFKVNLSWSKLYVITQQCFNWIFLASSLQFFYFSSWFFELHSFIPSLARTLYKIFSPNAIKLFLFSLLFILSRDKNEKKNFFSAMHCESLELKMRWQELSGKEGRLGKNVHDSRHRKSNLWRKSQLPWNRKEKQREKVFLLVLSCSRLRKAPAQCQSPFRYFCAFYFACVGVYRAYLCLQIFLFVLVRKLSKFSLGRKKLRSKAFFPYLFPSIASVPENLSPL